MYALFFPALWLLIQALQTPMTEVTPVMSCGTIIPEVTPGDILTSPDDGKTWRDLSPGLPAGSNPTILETIGDDLYLGTRYGLYKGSALLLSPNWHKDPLNQNDITGIYPGKNGPYSISYRKGIFQYQAATGMWVTISEHLKDKDIYTLLEARNGDLFAGGQNGLYRSTDHGGSWEFILDRDHIFQLLETEGGLIVRSEHGLWRSPDRGDNWSRSLQTVNAPFFVGHVGEHLMAICGGEGFMGLPAPNMVYRSSDQGVTWTPMAEFVTSPLFSIQEIRKYGDTLYASCGEGLFRSDDQGKSWVAILKSTENKSGFFKIAMHENILFALYMQGC